MLQKFINSFKSVVLSTIDINNNPFSSYAPYIKVEDKYYIYISFMAMHYENLDKYPKASLFFIEDENKTSNIFARKRVVLQCNSTKLPRDIQKFEELIKIFEEEHGETVKVLKQMKDFSIFEFKPFYGEAVFGFGEAYNIGGENCDKLIPRENQKGHKR